MSHTPGQWSVIDTMDDRFEIGNRRVYVAITHDRPDAAADASLIAAAPDLLAALLEIRDATLDVLQHFGGHLAVLSEEELDRLRAASSRSGLAIAKATG